MSDRCGVLDVALRAWALSVTNSSLPNGVAAAVIGNQ